MANGVIKIGPRESKEIISLSTKSPGIYEERLSIVGNAFVSTVFIETLPIGSSISIEYFDFTTGSGNGEQIKLGDHGLIDESLKSYKKVFSNFHDKPIIRITITGAPIKFGIYLTVKDLSEADANLSMHNAPILIENQKGMVIGGYDSVEEKFQFLPIENDAVRVSGAVDIEAPDGLPVYPSGLRNGGRISQVTLNENTWTALPAIPLANRNAMAIQNHSGKSIALNYSNAVSGFTGIIIHDLAERSYNITESIVLYAKSQRGTAIVTVEELS